MKNNRVYIVRPDTSLYAPMFVKRGWEVVSSMYDATLVLFTGGEDVDPSMYGQQRHPLTSPNYMRDAEEKKEYDLAKELGLPMVGICRGGQFLNVVNTGTMWQHVNNHNGRHAATVLGINKTIEVSSDHHQMMRPSLIQDVIVLLEAVESTKKEDMLGGAVKTRYITKEYPEVDIEALYYPLTNSLCFQPHPEYQGYNDCQDVFFWFIDNYSLTKESPKAIIKDNIPF